MKKQRRFRRGQMALALLLVVALLVSGTLAWQAISQNAINTSYTEYTSGVRLHDNFHRQSGNKDVFVENFGERPVLVRVRFSEFMTQDGNVFAPNTSPYHPHGGIVPVVGEDGEPTGATVTYAPWTVRRPLPGLPHISQEEAGVRHFGRYVRWDLGGQKWFMPTHNMDGLCLASTASGDGVCYLTWEPNAVGRMNGTDNDGTENFWAPLSYCSDTGEPIAQYTYAYRQLRNSTWSNVEHRHYAQETIPHTVDVMTMSEWNNLGYPIGDFWVADYDGWFYWAAMLQPGEFCEDTQERLTSNATSLLLDHIRIQPPDGDWRYSINVEMQSALAHTWEYAFNNTYTDCGENLILVVIGAPIEMRIRPSALTVGEGGTVTLTAERTRRGREFPVGDVTWQISPGTIPEWAEDYIRITEIEGGQTQLIIGTRLEDFEVIEDVRDWLVLYTCETTGRRLIITRTIHEHRRFHSAGSVVQLQNAEIRTHLNNWFNSNANVSPELRAMALPAEGLFPDVRSNHNGRSGWNNTGSASQNWVNANWALEGNMPAATSFPVTFIATAPDGEQATQVITVSVRNRTGLGPSSNLPGYSRPGAAGTPITNANHPAFFLSIAEVNYHFNGQAARSVPLASTAVSMNFWWLRSPGYGPSHNQATVMHNGMFHTRMANLASVTSQQNFMRPAMWIEACPTWIPGNP